MDASLRRGTFGRIPAFALLFLVALSVILVSQSVGGAAEPSHIYRREASRLVWRQEGGGEEVDSPPGSSSGGNNGTKVFETSTRATTTTRTSAGVTTTTTSSTSTGLSTSTSTTRTLISTTTATSTRSTTIPISTTTSSSVSSITTTSTSTSSIPITTSRSSSNTRSQPLRTTTSDTPATTLTVPADFVEPTSSTAETSTQPGNGFVGENNSPTPTANTGEAVGAAQKGFLQNKGAVAGVSVVIVLVIVALLGLLFIHVARRRAAARQRKLHAQLFGNKYSKSQDSEDAQGNHGRSGSGGSAGGHGGSEKNVVYDDSRFRGATVTSEYPFGPGKGLGAFPSSQSSAPAALSQPSFPPAGQQQFPTSHTPSQNPALASLITGTVPALGQYSSSGSNYPYNPPSSAGGQSVESHYTQEDPFYTPPGSESHSPNLGLQPSMIPTLTVTSPHNTQYLARVPSSGSTIFSQPGTIQAHRQAQNPFNGPGIQSDGASTYSQQSYEGLAYDYRDSAAPVAAGPGGMRGSIGQVSIDSFYGGPASAGFRGPTITVQY